MSDRLSDVQERFLIWLLERYRQVEDHGNDFAKKNVEAWGISLGGRQEGISRSESASLSRGLRRLEARGLVRRRNDRQGDRYSHGDSPELGSQRTTRVQFTLAGRELADRLTRDRAS
jgi:hypothetical protein